MSDRTTVTYRLNGTERSETVPSNTVLADLLRDRHGMTGVKLSCERGVCGSCTGLVDDRPVATCSMMAFQVEGAHVEVVDGESDDPHIGAAQRAFRERGGFQCGYCTSGMIVLTAALLRRDPDPDPATVRAWISSNVCRCTGYGMILESVLRAGEIVREGQNA